MVQPDGSVDDTSNRKQFNKFNRGLMIVQKMYRYGFDNDSFPSFDNSITISLLSRKRIHNDIGNPMISTMV